jgi:hypothetical protein
LTGEKFLAALGIAAPVDVAALAVQPTEFTKRIAAAANTVNVSLRMGSPIRLASPDQFIRNSGSPSINQAPLEFGFFHTTFQFYRGGF